MTPREAVLDAIAAVWEDARVVAFYTDADVGDAPDYRVVPSPDLPDPAAVVEATMALAVERRLAGATIARAVLMRSLVMPHLLMQRHDDVLYRLTLMWEEDDDEEDVNDGYTDDEPRSMPTWDDDPPEAS